MIKVAHPYNGKIENKQKAETILINLYKRYNNVLFISPIHSLGYIYNEFEYNAGMKYCFELLAMCDELWLFGGWRNSRGCKLEYNFAKKRGIKICFAGKGTKTPAKLKKPL